MGGSNKMSRSESWHGKSMCIGAGASLLASFPPGTHPVLPLQSGIHSSGVQDYFPCVGGITSLMPPVQVA